MYVEVCLEKDDLKKWYIKTFKYLFAKIKVMPGLLRPRQNIVKIYYYNQKCLSFSKLGRASQMQRKRTVKTVLRKRIRF